MHPGKPLGPPFCYGQLIWRRLELPIQCEVAKLFQDNAVPMFVGEKKRPVEVIGYTTKSMEVHPVAVNTISTRKGTQRPRTSPIAATPEIWPRPWNHCMRTT